MIAGVKHLRWYVTLIDGLHERPEEECSCMIDDDHDDSQTLSASEAEDIWLSSGMDENYDFRQSKGRPVAQKQDDSYAFSYEFEYIAKNHGNDNYVIDTATMNVRVIWSDTQDGYEISYEVPDMHKIDPAEGNSDAAGFYDYDVYPRLMNDLSALGVHPESITWGGF